VINYTEVAAVYRLLVKGESQIISAAPHYILLDHVLPQLMISFWVTICMRWDVFTGLRVYLCTGWGMESCNKVPLVSGHLMFHSYCNCRYRVFRYLLLFIAVTTKSTVGPCLEQNSIHLTYSQCISINPFYYFPSIHSLVFQDVSKLL
jgi:hypothetical protein